MNVDSLQARWPRVKDAVRARWQKLTDEDFVSLDGEPTRLPAMLRTRYGWTKARVEEELGAFTEDHEGELADSIARLREGFAQVGAGARTVAEGATGVLRAGTASANDTVQAGVERARAQSHRALDAVGDFVRERPLVSLGIAFAAGYLLLGRRR